ATGRVGFALAKRDKAKGLRRFEPERAGDGLSSVDSGPEVSLEAKDSSDFDLEFSDEVVAEPGFGVFDSSDGDNCEFELTTGEFFKAPASLAGLSLRTRPQLLARARLSARVSRV